MQRKTKRRIVAGAAAAALLAGGTGAVMATNPYAPPPLPDCSTMADVVASADKGADASAFGTVTDLVDNPASAASLAVQAIFQGRCAL